MDPSHGAETLVAPFVGFVAGTVLFGMTMLQAYQYFSRYSKDPLLRKIQVAIICLLDLLHFVFSTHMVYTFLISNFGAIKPSMTDTWSLKALSVTQAILIVMVQIMYLQRIHTFSSVPALNGERFSKTMIVVVFLIASCAVGIGIVFCYAVQSVDAIPSSDSDGDLEWVIYLGFGATALVDGVITATMCFVLQKNRAEIGTRYISKQSDRVLMSFFTFSLATGLLTTLAAGLTLILYMARPNTLYYLSVTFITTRLYTNSLLSLLQNVRRQHKDNSMGTREFRPPSGLVFKGVPASLSTGSRIRRSTTNIDTSVLPGPRGVRKTSPALSDSGSESEYDVEAQNRGSDGHEDVDVYSPFYSPLEARKRVGTTLQVREPEDMGGRSWVRFWMIPGQSWFNWSIDRRSSL